MYLPVKTPLQCYNFHTSSGSQSDSAKMHKVGGLKFTPHATWADPEGGGTGGPDPPPPEKSQKYRVSLQYWSRSLKNHKDTKPAFTVGPSSARQRNTIEMVFRWEANDGPFIAVFGSSILPLTEKNVIKLDPLSQTFWIRTKSLYICDVKKADYCYVFLSSM